MMEKAKIKAVIEYLTEEFPDCQIGDWDDNESLSHKFSVDNEPDPYILRIARRLFEKNTSDMKKLLQSLGAAEAMRSNKDGVEIVEIGKKEIIIKPIAGKGLLL